MGYKIIIDSLTLLSPLSGIGRYNYEIAHYFSQDEQYEMTYFYGYTSKNLISITDQPINRSLRHYIIKNHLLKTIARKLMLVFVRILTPTYDLYWQPNFIPLKGIKAHKTIASVHDFSWEIFPQFHPQERIDYFKQNFYSSLEHCDHIITGSYFTKQEIIERTGFDTNRISVIYHGINHSLFYPRPHSTLQQKFILAVGSIEPRKNLKNLLLAYDLLDTSMQEEYHLVLVGAGGWENKEIMELIEKMHLCVTYSGYVDDAKLAELYSDATLFIYPSFYEGFGIPPLEAMASGTPVISSNASTLPEICADAAYFIDPHDIVGLKNAIISLVNTKELRETFICKGLKRASEFSWEKSAKEHEALFEKVLSN